MVTPSIYKMMYEERGILERELAATQRIVEAARAVEGCIPVVGHAEHCLWTCAFCDADSGDIDSVPHQPDCEWLVLCRAIEAYDKENE
jgi:hypothetical protein